MVVNNTGKIFVIDDEETIHELVELIFEDEGYEVMGVVNAHHLLSKIIDFQPDIVLLDIHLLGADGRALCNQIKANANTAHIPVILLSALNLRGLNLSCQPDCIIEKPFDIMELVQKVNYFLNKGGGE